MAKHIKIKGVPKAQPDLRLAVLALVSFAEEQRRKEAPVEPTGDREANGRG